jgi:hypothetical protein
MVIKDPKDRIKVVERKRNKMYNFLFLITFAEHCRLAGPSCSVHHKRFLGGPCDVFLIPAEKIQKTQEMNKRKNYVNYFKGTLAPD